MKKPEENGKPGDPPDYEKLYETLLFDLHHGIRSASCTILGVLSLDLTDAEKLVLIEIKIKALDAKTFEISKKHNDLTPDK